MEFENQKQVLQQNMKHDKMQEETMHKATVERLVALKNEEISKFQESLIAVRQQHAAEVCTPCVRSSMQLTAFARSASCERNLRLKRSSGKPCIFKK